MDQWKVQAPDGAHRLLKLIYGHGLRNSASMARSLHCARCSIRR